MIDINNMSSKTAVQEQYKNTDNLKLRKSLHEKYSVNKTGFQKWMFEQYPFREKMKVLELGSGRGELWNYYFENSILRSYEMNITLSDFSDGMVEYLWKHYLGMGISVRKIDILDIPFEKDTFDLIIANSMLYHVKDIDSAISEVKRVLKKSGLFYCATFGMNGMTQYLYHALDELGIPYNHESNISFTLQNGMQLLKKQFDKVERFDYEDALAIDNIEDYLEYIYSMASLQGLDPQKYDILFHYFDSRKVNGSVKSTSMFFYYKPHIFKDYTTFSKEKAMTSLFCVNTITNPQTLKGKSLLMDIIPYLLSLIQFLYQQNCWLINFICRYIPLRQWAFDDSHSPKYQKFKIDELPLVTDFRQDWTYKELIPYYEKRYGRKIRPVSRRSDCDIPDDCSCPRCNAPKPFLYKNNGSKGQILCKVCAARFSPSESRFSCVKLRCPHCGNALVPKKDRKHFIVHKCVNPKCPYYLHNLRKVDRADLDEDYGKNKYKLHYIYREFTMDFFSMDLNTLPRNASSLKFSKHNAHVMSLCLTLHVNLGLSLRKTSQALKDLYNISISHQQIANYCKTAAICVKPFVDQYPYEKGDVFTADETYIKIRGIKNYVWLIMNAATRSIIGYQVSDNRGAGPCILAMRMAFRNLAKLPENFKFIADGYSAYPLAAMEFVKKLGRDFTFKITQVIGLTNDDAVSTEYRPFKQMIERLNRTYKASYRHTNGFDSIDGASYDLALWVAYYNFLRPHKHNKYNVLNEVEMLQGADNMPGKWQMLIFLGQQTILNMQKNGTAQTERSCCQ